ncbi:MAG: hypothetical protein SPJ34_03075, partial [Candidatus Ornithospirochaeta sp.]|nr:hypothetical protein [Candidatus Ornithospirochaeta sp.]
MESGKKTMGPVGLGILSSLSESYTLLPFMVYSSLISGQGGSVSFFIPVVILYSIERACLIALRGFGEIANPYRILRNGLVIALIGSLLMVLSAFCRPLLAVSALFVGIGLSPMRAMFIPLSSRLIEENPGLKKGKAIGTLLYFAIMIAALVLGKLSIHVVPVLFLLYIAASAAIAFRLDG